MYRCQGIQFRVICNASRFKSPGSHPGGLHIFVGMHQVHGSKYTRQYAFKGTAPGFRSPSRLWQPDNFKADSQVKHIMRRITTPLDFFKLESRVWSRLTTSLAYESQTPGGTMQMILRGLTIVGNLSSICGDSCFFKSLLLFRKKEKKKSAWD